jgi:peptidoglycan/LPS O-acetylase OafA/YrhL
VLLDHDERCQSAQAVKEEHRPAHSRLRVLAAFLGLGCCHLALVLAFGIDDEDRNLFVLCAVFYGSVGVNNLGSIAVDAFFVLSAFLLTMLFMKKSIRLIAEEASFRKWTFTLADYFSKRFFRVYPLFALLSITLWLLPFEYKRQYYLVKKPEDFNLFQTLTFHPEHRHYLMWTLPLENSYYFLLPVFVFAVLKLGRLWWVPFIALYAWAIHEGLYKTRDNFYKQPLKKHLPTFVVGSMAAVLFVKLEAWIKTSGFQFRKSHMIGVRAIESILVAAYLSVSFRGLFFNWLHASLPHTTNYFMPFTSVKLSLLIVIEMIVPSAVSTIFEWSVLRYCGKISFSIYLLHVFVIFTRPIKDQVNYYDKMFSIFGLVILLATVSYHSVEYPSQLLAQRISSELAKRESAQQPALMGFSVLEDGFSNNQTTPKASAAWDWQLNGQQDQPVHFHFVNLPYGIIFLRQFEKTCVCLARLVFP